MTYVQFLRLRKMLTIYAIMTGAVFLIFVAVAHAPNASFQIDGVPRHQVHHSSSMPLSGVLFLSAWCAIIFATIVGMSLNRENDGVEMVWTKPIARGRLAVEYILMDFAGIVVAFAFAVALCLLALASVGSLASLTVDARTLPTLVIGLGAAVMWYGLLQGISSWQPGGRGGLVIGVSWTATFVLASMAGGTINANQSLHQFFLAIDVINPVAYFSSYTLSAYGAHASPVLPQALAGTEMRSTLTWGIGLLGCTAAVIGWKRLEV
jgi:hypothetical protein